ncbi:odorant receptor 82a [Drosophila busckii]|uniref:odorant receptor 82a n=1 Tax=Drosophila busckii TaxID=30019 RepID=UPI00083F0A29|nr:odorant receptor 82a [Drosophila busckii]
MVRLFQLQEQCLRVMGHNMVVEPLTLSLKHIASLAFVLSAQYPLVSYALHNRDDLELITAGLSVVFTNMLTVIKISTFLAYKQDYWRMIQGFRQMYLQSRRLQHCGYDYVTPANKLATKLGKAYFFSCGFTGLYFMLTPIVMIISSNWRGVSVARELPMPMKFPFNDTVSPGYECGYVYTMIVTIVVVLYASAVDGLFISFAINLRAHFQTLQDTIVQAATDSVQLIDAINYHVLLLDMSQRLRLIFMPIVFGQFFITSLQVGVIIYQIVTHMDSVMSLLVYFSFFGSIMLQLFLYCYGGEIIKVESLQVGVAVQLSDWHLATPKQRRSLAFIMQRAQREMIIKAGFYEASLANFVAICRAALSLITLIQSIEGTEVEKTENKH